MEDERGRDPTSLGHGGSTDVPRDPATQQLAGERKPSRRREAQEERLVVIDLFKELISKINEGTITLIRVTQVVHSPTGSKATVSEQ